MYTETKKSLQVPPSLPVFLKDLFPIVFLSSSTKNYFNFCTKHLKFIYFANDKDKSLSGLTTGINTELYKVVKWLQIN